MHIAQYGNVNCEDSDFQYVYGDVPVIFSSAEFDADYPQGQIIHDLVLMACTVLPAF